MATVSGTHQVVFALQQHGEDMERAMGAELDVLARFAQTRMMELAPKGANSLLWKTMVIENPQPMERVIGPTADYAAFVESGVKPGGKGLPKMPDIMSSSGALGWLKGRPDKGGATLNRQHLRTRRKGSKVFDAATESLRNRYYGLSLSIRKFGTKLHPFVEPTAKEMETAMPRRLDLAVRRVLAARPNSDGAVA